jgi:chromosomal replication initiator protein
MNQQHISYFVRPGLTDVQQIINPKKIINTVSHITKISISDMTSSCRKKELLFARYYAIYYLRKHTDMTLKELGLVMGNRDHATIINSLKIVNNLMETKQIDEVFYEIGRQLTGQ